VQQELKLQNKHLERLNNELLKAIKRVVEGEKKFKRIFDFTSDSIVVVDDKLSVKIANRSFCNMFGYSHQEVAHLSIKALFKNTRISMRICSKYLMAKCL
jgi:PAS domain-containing protein